MEDLSAFVLAGGKSTRMGRDKAFLRFESETLLQRALRLAKGVTERVWIVGDAERFASEGKVVQDRYRGCGPLGGIHAALSSTGTEFNLFLAVDLPFLQVEFLRHLVSEAQRVHASVTVPMSGGRLQPLCSVYRREFGVLAQEALLRGEYKIDALFARTETRVLPQSELDRKGFTEEMFHNMNTPEDLLIKTSRI